MNCNMNELPFDLLLGNHVFSFVVYSCTHPHTHHFHNMQDVKVFWMTLIHCAPHHPSQMRPVVVSNPSRPLLPDGGNPLIPFRFPIPTMATTTCVYSGHQKLSSCLLLRQLLILVPLSPTVGCPTPFVCRTILPM